MNTTNTSLAQKREAIEKNKAVKQALHDKMLAIICEEHGLPPCLAPYARFNKCSISLVAKNMPPLEMSVASIGCAASWPPSSALSAMGQLTGKRTELRVGGGLMVTPAARALVSSAMSCERVGLGSSGKRTAKPTEPPAWVSCAEVT